MSDAVREALEAIKRAKQEVCDVASGRRRWTMCVPVQEGTDTDRVLMNALTLAESALAAATPGEPTQACPNCGVHWVTCNCGHMQSPEATLRPTPTPETRTPEEWARWARRQNTGFIDKCSADLVGSGEEATKLCPVCEAIERVATIAVRAALRAVGEGA